MQIIRSNDQVNVLDYFSKKHAKENLSDLLMEYGCYKFGYRWYIPPGVSGGS